MRYKFAPAAPGEKIVFGSERPAARTHAVSDTRVQEWRAYMQDKGIQRVV
jgi:hypothetical protein